MVRNRKPVKILGNRGDMVKGVSNGEQAGGQGLDILEFLRVLDVWL